MVILAAVGEKSSPNRIIETAHELAVAFDDELQVLHVIPEKDADRHFEALRSIEEFEDVSFDVELDRAEEMAERLIDSVLGDAARDGVSAVGRVGDPADEILATVDLVEPRYVVIGGQKRTPAGKAVFGSVTQSVILNSDSPTVTVLVED